MTTKLFGIVNTGTPIQGKGWYYVTPSVGRVYDVAGVAINGEPLSVGQQVLIIQCFPCSSYQPEYGFLPLTMENQYGQEYEIAEPLRNKVIDENPAQSAMFWLLNQANKRFNLFHPGTVTAKVGTKLQVYDRFTGTTNTYQCSPITAAEFSINDGVLLASSPLYPEGWVVVGWWQTVPNREIMRGFIPIWGGGLLPVAWDGENLIYSGGNDHWESYEFKTFPISYKDCLHVDYIANVVNNCKVAPGDVNRPLIQYRLTENTWNNPTPSSLPILNNDNPTGYRTKYIYTFGTIDDERLTKTDTHYSGAAISIPRAVYPSDNYLVFLFKKEELTPLYKWQGSAAGYSNSSLITGKLTLRPGFRSVVSGGSVIYIIYDEQEHTWRSVDDYLPIRYVAEDGDIPASSYAYQAMATTGGGIIQFDGIGSLSPATVYKYESKNSLPSRIVYSYDELSSGNFTLLEMVTSSDIPEDPLVTVLFSSNGILDMRYNSVTYGDGSQRYHIAHGKRTILYGFADIGSNFYSVGVDIDKLRWNFASSTNTSDFPTDGVDTNWVKQTYGQIVMNARFGTTLYWYKGFAPGNPSADVYSTVQLPEDKYTYFSQFSPITNGTFTINYTATALFLLTENEGDLVFKTVGSTTYFGMRSQSSFLPSIDFTPSDITLYEDQTVMPEILMNDSLTYGTVTTTITPTGNAFEITAYGTELINAPTTNLTFHITDSTIYFDNTPGMQPNAYLLNSTAGYLIYAEDETGTLPDSENITGSAYLAYQPKQVLQYVLQTEFTDFEPQQATFNAPESTLKQVRATGLPTGLTPIATLTSSNIIITVTLTEVLDPSNAIVYCGNVTTPMPAGTYTITVSGATNPTLSVLVLRDNESWAEA